MTRGQEFYNAQEDTSRLKIIWLRIAIVPRLVRPVLGFHSPSLVSYSKREDCAPSPFPALEVRGTLAGKNQELPHSFLET